MPTFSHGSVEIAYLDEGQGDPIILIHGFASSKDVNWFQTSWFTTLKGAGRRVIALDNRGHGQSAKLYDPADYHTLKMASDVRALMAHLSIRRADVMGYSMGARITAFLALESPELTRTIVLGGLGSVTGSLIAAFVVGYLETLTAYLDAKDIVVQDRFVEEYATDLKDGTDDSLDVNIYALVK